MRTSQPCFGSRLYEMRERFFCILLERKYTNLNALVRSVLILMASADTVSFVSFRYENLDGRAR